MIPAYDSEPCLEGVSDLMKIQVRVGPSCIAGQGLFAGQDIKKGMRIMQYIGEKISSRERARRLAAGNAYIFHLTYRYALDGQTLENTARYINHSCDPNSIVRQKCLGLARVALGHPLLTSACGARAHEPARFLPSPPQDWHWPK